MDFKQSVTTCLRKYADFNGRASRSEYWWFALFTVLVGLAAAIVIGDWAGNIASLILLLPSLAAATRRLHDMGKSGWFQLVWLVPLVGLILMVYWLVQRSVGPNEWGEGPAALPTEIMPPGAV